MYPRLTHLALHVENLDACIDFYRRYCGMCIIHQRQGGSKRIVWLSESGRDQDFVFVVMDGGIPSVAIKTRNVSDLTDKRYASTYDEHC